MIINLFYDVGYNFSFIFFSVKYLDKMSHLMKFLDQRSTLTICPLDEMPFARNGLTTEGPLYELSFR